MRPILILLRKDFRVFRSDKAAVALTFLVPFVLIYLFGQVFGVNRSDNGPTGIPLAVLNLSPNPAAHTLVDALKAEKTFKVLTGTKQADGSEKPFNEDELRARMRANEFRFAIVIPENLIAKGRLGIRLKVLSNPRNDIETQMVNGVLQKTLFTAVPELIGQSLQSSAREQIGDARMDSFNRSMASAIARAFGEDETAVLKSLEDGKFGFASAEASSDPGATSARAQEFLSQILKVESEQVAGQDIKSPAATRIVGGWAMQFLLFALSASATALFAERDQGLFQRLLSAPVTRAHLLWSKFAYGVCLGLIQLLVLFLAGKVLFGIEVEKNFLLLAVVCAFAAGACTAFCLLLASIAPSAEAARGLATFLILVMSAVGGAWFPISLMPEFIQQISKLTIVYWSMEGFAQVLWNGDGIVALLPTLGILAAMTAGVMAIAVWRFSRGRLFG